MVSLANDWRVQIGEVHASPPRRTAIEQTGDVIGPRVSQALLDVPAERNAPITPIIENAGKTAPADNLPQIR